MTVDPEMLKILQNLDNAQTLHEQKVKDRAAGKVVVTEDAKEMYDILKKLDDATTVAATRVVNEGTPITSNNKVSMGNYVIETEKRILSEGVYKTYYDIKDHKGKSVYTDIALFETAMAILKGLFNKKTQKIKELLMLDDKYNSYLQEAATHKVRAKRLNETYKKDVYAAKQSAAMSKANYTKKQIKALI